MSKQVRDGSATILKAKLTLAATTYKQLHRIFVKEPNQANWNALVEAGEEYLAMSAPVATISPQDADFDNVG